MENGWNAFWTSGKVEDYLAYCGHGDEKRAEQLQRQEIQRKVKAYGTVCDTDRNGLDVHAGGRI